MRKKLHYLFLDSLSFNEKEILRGKHSKIFEKIKLVLKNPYLLKKYFHEITNALLTIKRNYSWFDITNEELDFFLKNYEPQKENNFSSASNYLFLDLY